MMFLIQNCTIRCIIGFGLVRVELSSEISVHCQNSMAKGMDHWSVSMWQFLHKNIETQHLPRLL